MEKGHNQEFGEECRSGYGVYFVVNMPHRHCGCH